MDVSTEEISPILATVNNFHDCHQLNESIIDIQNLEKRFSNFVAVNGISIKIQKGELFSLLGPEWCRENNDNQNADHCIKTIKWGSNCQFFESRCEKRTRSKH